MDPAAVEESRRTWDAIATSFDSTRRVPWPPVVEFLEGLAPGSRLLDAGAGNGRHASPARDRRLAVAALDLSRGLLGRALARAPGLPVVQGVIERLPFRDGTFDALLCVAVVHHVRGRSNRIEAWRELARVLRRGAPALVSVWARDQPGFEAGWGDYRRPEPRAGVEPEPGDVELWWTQHGLRVPRFYHLYTGVEFRAELADAGLVPERVWKPALGVGDAPENHFARLRGPG